MNKFTIAIIMFTIAILACQSQVPSKKLRSKVELQNTPSPQYALVCMAGTLNFRSRPGTDKTVEYTFLDGTLVQVMDDTETTQDGAEWRQTEYGWVNSRFLCLEEK